MMAISISDGDGAIATQRDVHALASLESAQARHELELKPLHFYVLQTTELPAHRQGYL